MFHVISKEEWESIKKKGKFSFFLNEVPSSFCFTIALFCVLDFILNFGQQSPLIKIGIFAAFIASPGYVLMLWFVLKRKYSKR